MSYRTGIIAAQDGKTIDDTPQAYRSDYGHLLVDTRPGVGHLGIYEGYCGGSVLNVSTGMQEQIFFSIKHGLPFIPRVTAYILIRDAPVAMAALVNSYAGGYFTRDGFPASEEVFLRVTATHVYFVHQVTNGSPPQFPSPYSSIAQNTLIRAKYIINSNEALKATYETRLPFI